MRVELPELQRCCCCLPLRRGLLFWVYLKLILDLLLVAYSIAALVFYVAMNRGVSTFTYVLIVIQTIAFLMDSGFSILFLISAHRKRHEHMRLYYRYATGMLILGAIAMLGFIGFEIFIAIVSYPWTLFFLHHMVAFTCLLFTQLVLHAYLIVLVRSEVLKLERGAKFEFINHTSEPECKAQIIMSH